MKDLTNADDQVPIESQDKFFSSKEYRHSFRKYAGAGAGGIALIAAVCKKDSM